MWQKSTEREGVCQKKFSFSFRNIFPRISDKFMILSYNLTWGRQNKSKAKMLFGFFYFSNRENGPYLLYYLISFQIFIFINHFVSSIRYHGKKDLVQRSHSFNKISTW